MKELLLVVDYQVDFVDGALGFPGAEKLDNKIKEFIKQAEKSKMDIIFTQDTHFENYMETQEGNKLPVPHCILNTEGHNLYGQTSQAAQETQKAIFLQKNTFGSHTLLNHLLTVAPKYDKIHIVGLVTNICVISNAVICKTAQPEAEIYIYKDMVASFSEDLHNKALEVMAGLQMNII